MNEARERALALQPLGFEPIRCSGIVGATVDGEGGPSEARWMRVLFSSTRGAGHVQPLLPYARALMAAGTSWSSRHPQK